MNSEDAYDIICKIRQASGLNAKKAILRKNPSVGPYFRQIYDPYRHYGVIPTTSMVTGEGDRVWSPDDLGILDSLASGSLSGFAAKRAVRTTLASLAYKSAMLFYHVLIKDARCGLGIRSINEALPGTVPVHEVQLAHPIDYRRVKFPALASYKLDGLRACYKNGKLYSRLGNVFQGLGLLEQQLASLVERWSYDNGVDSTSVILDGELMVEGEHFNEISGQLRSFSDTEKAVFNLFDMPSLGERQQSRYAECAILANAPGLDTEQVKLLEHWLVRSTEEIDLYFDSALEQGHEGLIIKDPKAPYENRRTWAWQKVKAVRSMELKVIGTFEGRGKYAGLVGGLVCDYRGVSVRVGSGLSDRQRVDWAEDPYSVVGRIVEVAYHEETPDGSLRHPRLKTVRGDKDES